VRDESSEVRDGTLINDSLGELFSMLGDLTKSGRGDALKGKLGFLDAEDQKTDCTGIHNSLGKLMGVLGDASQSPSGSLLH
jgi:hypothetical protein